MTNVRERQHDEMRHIGKGMQQEIMENMREMQQETVGQLQGIMRMMHQAMGRNKEQDRDDPEPAERNRRDTDMDSIRGESDHESVLSTNSNNRRQNFRVRNRPQVKVRSLPQTNKFARDLSGHFARENRMW